VTTAPPTPPLPSPTSATGAPLCRLSCLFLPAALVPGRTAPCTGLPADLFARFGRCPPRNHSCPRPADRGVRWPLMNGGRLPAQHWLPCPPHPRRLGPDAGHTDSDDRRFVDASTTRGVITLKPAARTPVGGARLVDRRTCHAGPLGAAPIDARQAHHMVSPNLRGGARSGDQMASHAALKGAAPRDDRRAPDADFLYGTRSDDWQARLRTQRVGRRGHRPKTTGACTARGRRHLLFRAPTGTPGRASRGQPVRPCR